MFHNSWVGAKSDWLSARRYLTRFYVAELALQLKYLRLALNTP